MNQLPPLRVIARIRSDFTTKFGIPRQSGLVPEQKSVIVFEPEYRDANALRGFASRSPFRPNPIGLSSVRLLGLQTRPGLGTVLHVSGADLMDGTPIYDIKPYLSFTDSHPDAADGFAEARYGYALEVEFPEEWLSMIPEEKRAALVASLRQDPRPAYQNDPGARYGFEYAGFDVRFRVADGRLTVCEVVRL